MPVILVEFNIITNDIFGKGTYILPTKVSLNGHNGYYWHYRYKGNTNFINLFASKFPSLYYLVYKNFDLYALRERGNRMYMSFIKAELKKWARDSMMFFMLLYPLIFAFLGRFLLPWLTEKYGFNFEPFTDLILVILVLFIPISYGALIAFSLLEDRDDNVLTNIRVTPLKYSLFYGLSIGWSIYNMCNSHHICNLVFQSWQYTYEKYYFYFPLGFLGSPHIWPTRLMPLQGIRLKALQ